MPAASASNGAQSKNIRLLGHHDLGGFGNGGEGLGLQQMHDGRRILYIAHESAPKNFSVVDVTDPTQPQMIFQNELPHQHMRSNSLDVVGDLLVVAYQTARHGMTPAGVELSPTVAHPPANAAGAKTRPATSERAISKRRTVRLLSSDAPYTPTTPQRFPRT